LSIEHYPTSMPFPFADAVEAGGFIFLSGQVSMSAEGEPLTGTISAQAHRIMKSIEKTLARAGATLNHVVKVTVWLSNMKHFCEFNSVYRTYFSDGYPARSVTASRLVFDLDIEIEVQALAPKREL